jgi:hypothetical protein
MRSLLKNNIRQEFAVTTILRDIKTISIDPDISLKYSDLLVKYHDNRLQPPDAVIAATAWSKKLPLLTRNRKHFSYIEEIKLSPIYD